MNWGRCAALLLLSSVALAGPSTRLTLSVDGVQSVIEHRFWNAHPYVRLRDTANQLGWYPQVDEYHHIADLAGCLRLEDQSVNVFRVSASRLWSKSSVAILQPLSPLAVPTRTIGYDRWLPLDEVARRMGYAASFSAQRGTLTLVSPHASQPGTLEADCQQYVKSH